MRVLDCRSLVGEPFSGSAEHKIAGSATTLLGRISRSEYVRACGVAGIHFQLY